MTDIETRQAALWRKLHRDFKGKDASGVKVVLMLRHGGTHSIPLHDVTDEELKRYNV